MRTLTPTLTLTPRLVVTLAYQSWTDPDDAGVVDAYWTGELDAWGKYTWQPVDGSPGPLYLFADELFVE